MQEKPTAVKGHELRFTVAHVPENRDEKPIVLTSDDWTGGGDLNVDIGTVLEGPIVFKPGVGSKGRVL